MLKIVMLISSLLIIILFLFNSCNNASDEDDTIVRNVRYEIAGSSVDYYIALTINNYEYYAASLSVINHDAIGDISIFIYVNDQISDSESVTGSGTVDANVIF